MANSPIHCSNWKFHDSKTGTTAVALPTDWSEILVTVAYGWNNPYGVTFYIPRCHETNNPRLICNGYCENPSNEYGNTIISFNYTNNTVAVIYNKRNGNDYIANAVIRVYYR